MKYGDVYFDNKLIFCKEHGEYIDNKQPNRRLKAALKRADIEADINYHSLRHIFITNCISNDINIKTVMDWVGHADINVTMKIYAEINKEKNLKEFNDKINKNPRDLQLLGVGANGHIAFNEPNDFLHSDALCIRLDKKTIKANSRYFKSEKQVPKEAFSMGMGGILKAKKIVIAAIGKNKASAIKELLLNDKITTKCPVTFLKLHNDVTVIIDEEIAKAIGYKSSKK